MALHSSINPGLQTSDDGDKIAFGENVRVFAEEARVRLAEAGSTLNTLVTTRPALALGAALAAGVVVGWLIKRR